MVQLVETLRYKPEVRGRSGFRFPVKSLRFFQPYYDPGIESASNRNKYPEYLLGGKGVRCLGMINLSPSCADRVEILCLSRTVIG